MSRRGKDMETESRSTVAKDREGRVAGWVGGRMTAFLLGVMKMF